MREALSRPEAAADSGRAGAEAPAPSPAAKGRDAGRSVDIDRLLSMVAVVGRDRRYRHVNAAYAAWTGRDRATIEGRLLSDVLPPELMRQIAPFVDRALAGETVAQEIAFPNPQGATTHLAFRYLPEPDGFLAFVSDVTAQRRMEFRLSTKNSITQSLWEARTVEEAAAGALGALCRYLDARGGILWLDTGDGRLACASVIAPAESTRRALAEGSAAMTFGRGEGVVGGVWEKGAPVFVAELSAAPDFLRRDLVAVAGLRGLLAVPLTLGPRVIGVIEFFFDRGGAPDADVMSMLAGIVSQLAQFVERVRAEDALRNSEWRLMLMTDLVPQLIWSADPAGRVDFYSSRHSEYAGFSRNADGTWNWTPVVHPEDLEASRAAWEGAVRTGTPYEIEHRIGAADGTFRWHLSRAMPLRDHLGAISRWYGSATDIHALKTAQAEAERLLAERQVILETMAQGLALVGPDGHVSYINPAGRRILRWEEAGTAGPAEAVWTARRPRDLDGRPVPVAALPHMRALAGERVRGQVLRMALPDGTACILRFDVEPFAAASGARAGAIVTFEDVTERQAAEERLRDSEARLRATFEGVTDAIVTFDAAGRITNFNPAFLRLHGDPGGDARDDACGFDLRTPDGRLLPDGERPVTRALAGEIVKEMELHVSRKGAPGSGYVGSFTAIPIRDDRGGLLQVVVTIRDVTERRRAQRRHDLMTRELNHRARNALAVVQAITRLTRAATVADYGAAVRGRVEALVRSHARLADGDWQELPLRQLVRDELAPFLGAGSQRLVLTGDAIRLAPDAVQPMTMALHEMATNAARYGALSVPSGRIRVQTRLGAEGGFSLLWTEEGGPPDRAAGARGRGPRAHLGRGRPARRDRRDLVAAGRRADRLRSRPGRRPGRRLSRAGHRTGAGRVSPRRRAARPAPCRSGARRGP